jgi:hypothetical protein
MQNSSKAIPVYFCLKTPVTEHCADWTVPGSLLVPHYSQQDRPNLRGIVRHDETTQQLSICTPLEDAVRVALELRIG